MRKHHEALLVAALAGLVIAGAAAFVIQPVFGGHTQKYAVSLASLPIPNQLLGRDVFAHAPQLLPPVVG